MSTLFPRAGLMTDLDDHEWFSYQDHHGRTVRVSGPVYYDKLRQLYHEDATRRWHDPAGQEVVHLAPFALRLFFPQESRPCYTITA